MLGECHISFFILSALHFYLTLSILGCYSDLGVSANLHISFYPPYIAHRLNHKREQDDHPQPVGSAETGAVEQREWGEEGSAEGDERGEGELPFSPRGVDDEATLFFCFSQTENQGVGSLYKHEKHQQGS